MMSDDQPLDLVDEYLRPLVRPIGNIFILYANAEAALRDFVMHVSQLPETEAHRIVSDQEWQNIAQLIENCGLDPSSIDDLRNALTDYVKARDERNRLAQDEWQLAIDVDNSEASVALRELERKGATEPIYDELTVDQLWQLARRIASVRGIFESAALTLA